MKMVEAKIVANFKEDPASEPDQEPSTWLIEAKLDEDIIDWRATRFSNFRDRSRNRRKQYVRAKSLHDSYATSDRCG